MLLGLDFETTGLDTKTIDIIEIGAVLFEEERKVPVKIMNWLIKGPTVPAEITALTGIHQADLDYAGVPFEMARNGLLEMMGVADFVVAHNGTNFDRPIAERLIAPLNDMPKWIDTSVDVPYPAQITTRKLTHLAAEHDFLNPFAHRAVFDVLTMLRVLSKYDIEEVKRISQIPNVTLFAMVSYQDRELAKSAGYRWEGETKSWKKTVKLDQVEAERAKAQFEVRAC
jgi:DNA polymerase III epsilon subunit-like protein